MKSLVILSLVTFFIGMSNANAKCGTGPDCKPSENCVNTKVFGFACQSKPNPNATKVKGDPCTSNSECKSNACMGGTKKCN